MFYFLFPILLNTQNNGIDQIEEKKYTTENFSEFNADLIKQRMIDSIEVVRVRGEDSILSTIYTFDTDGYNIKKSDYLPDGKTVASQYTYKWNNKILESQTIATFHKGKVQKINMYNYEYLFPKITTKAISENGKAISVKVSEYDLVDSTLSKEMNYSVENGKNQPSTTATYSYSADGTIIVKYYDDNNQLGLRTIKEKSKHVNAVSEFTILPNGEIEDTRILFYDKDNNLVKSIINRNSTSSTTIRVYKEDLLHEVIYPTDSYVFKYYFKINKAE